MLKEFFIPCEQNEYYPLSVRPKLLFTYVVFLAVFNIFAINYLSYFPSNTLAQATFTSTDIITLTNQDRQQNGVQILQENKQLDTAAANKAADMMKYNYWAHTNPTTNATPWDFITAAGYNYHYAGENLAEGFDTAQDTNTAWMNSAGHKANILNTQYQDIGVAVVYGMYQNTNQTLVVQMFGALQVAAPVPSPIAQTPTPTPKPTASPTPSAKPYSVISNLVQTPSPTAITTPEATVISGTTSAPNIAGKQTLIQAKGQSTFIQNFSSRITSITFANKVNIFVALFLLFVFSLDSLFYAKVRSIHPRQKANSMAHLPVFIILLFLCIIGVSGFTL